MYVRIVRMYFVEKLVYKSLRLPPRTKPLRRIRYRCINCLFSSTVVDCERNNLSRSQFYNNLYVSREIGYWPWWSSTRQRHLQPWLSLSLIFMSNDNHSFSGSVCHCFALSNSLATIDDGFRLLKLTAPKSGCQHSSVRRKTS